ncbi:class I SAM-dependent methyltransferase [Rhizobium sp. NLR4b]|uniref:N-6 DNA methylase n=1 Tax=Rhizobium sp. NLR4b TaxID=2731118 RepID=UPI001C82F7EC|nr:class I SAM-dependent methyltransferase [Rhizobium sp. NLR4b]MBX5253351.1 class I SAM-dependent methyltransferase [Rhizobium sp. NLR4b]
MTTPHLKSIVKLFESCRYRHDLYTVFSDWCECAAISLSNAMDVTQREKREARYMKIVGRYERNVVETFPKIMGEVMMALEAGPQDILGSAFHELELHNTARGQFFTPYALCQMMAVMQIGDHTKTEIEQRGYITAHEPAVGAGATIIALAEALKNAGINYQQHLHVVAVDIDPRAVHMAYIQFSLMHIPAQVIVGDTLRLEFHEDWFTPAHIMGYWSGRLAADRRPQEISIEIAKPEPPPPELIEPPPRAATGLPLFDFGL